jgi:hypothetical protein
MKKIISFCLWGNHPKYCTGAIKNSKLANKIYPDWISRFYIHNKVDKTVIEQIQNNNSEIIIINNEPEAWSNMFWRFKPIEDPQVDVFICRDTDSRLNEREQKAVEQWLISDKSVHIMRDHPYHGFSMLGGMIGFKKEAFQILQECLKKFKAQNEYGTDYTFFNNILYPQIQNLAITNDEFFEKKPFPTARQNYEFVGQVYDENDITVKEHVNSLQKYLSNEIF